MDFSVIQNFASAPGAIVRAYASADTYGHLAGLPKLATPEVLERRIDGDVVRLRVRHRFVGTCGTPSPRSSTRSGSAGSRAPSTTSSASP